MWKNLTKRFQTEGLLILGLLISAMISVYLSIAVCLTIIIYTLITKKFLSIVRSMPGSLSISGLCVLAFAVSIIYRNQYGILIAAGMSIIFLVGMFLWRYMTRDLFETCITLCCQLSILCFFVEIVQVMVWGDIPYYRAPSTFMNANYYAMMIEFIITFCLYRILSKPARSIKSILFYSFVIVINISGLFLSGCRTGLIVILLVGLVMLLLYKRYSLFWIGLSLEVAYALISHYYPGFLPREETLNSDFLNRISIWSTALKGIAGYPIFGRGGDTYIKIYSAFEGLKAIHAHNLLLDMLLNYGVVGTGLLIAYLTSILGAIFRRDPKLLNSNIKVVVITACLCVFIHGIMDITIFWVQTGLIFLFILSCGGKLFGTETISSPNT